MLIIKLNFWASGEPFLVNAESICMIELDEGDRQNAVIPFTFRTGGTGRLRVRNTPEEGLRLIKEAKNEN